MSTRILQFFFECLTIANFIEKCNKNFYQTSSKISIGRPLESTRHPIELLYWTFPRADDLAEYCCCITKGLFGPFFSKTNFYEEGVEVDDTKHFQNLIWPVVLLYQFFSCIVNPPCPPIGCSLHPYFYVMQQQYRCSIPFLRRV